MDSFGHDDFESKPFIGENESVVNPSIKMLNDNDVEFAPSPLTLSNFELSVFID